MERRQFPLGTPSVLSVTFCSTLLRLQFVEEPGTRMRPVVVGGAGRDAHGVRSFFERHANEITQLDRFGFGLALPGECVGG